MTQLAIVPAAPLNALQTLAESAAAYASDSTSKATRKAYRRDAGAFLAWAETRGLDPSTPSTIGLYLASMADAGRKVSTIERALVSIGAGHRATGHEAPTAHPAVRLVMAGIRRRLGTAQAKKAAVRADQLGSMMRALPRDVSGTRDRALLLVGFFGALRRSELVALDVRDVRFVAEGAIVTVRRSKTDQEGKGLEKGLPTTSDESLCPVRALRAWLAASGITQGQLFRAVDRHGRISETRLSDRSVARIVQRAADDAGIEADFAGHSLRAGFATTAAARGKSLDAIMKQTGHRSERVARGYIRHATLFTDNAASGLV
jgi:integrase